MKKNIFFFFLLQTTIIFSQSYFNEFTPHRIILNLTEAPSSCIAVTFRTIARLPEPKVQIAEATVWKDFAESAESFTPKEELFEEKDIAVYYYSKVLENLKPNTIYTYRVGSEKGWSEWNQFTTASDKKEPFTFVYFGDPQNNLKEHCSRIFRKAYQKVPEASFWLFGGDITSNPVDNEWDELFYAAGFTFRVTPMVMSPGNHDHILYNEDGRWGRRDSIGVIWNASLTQPENGLKGLEEISFYYDYQGVRFIVLDSHRNLTSQAQWMDEILTNNPNQWSIVSFHHPLYSAGRERKTSKRRDAFLKIFDKHNVDLVLTGHDHTYARSKKLRNNQVVADNEKGTVYVVSVSGPKAYDVNSLDEDLMAKMGNEVQLFQEIRIDGNTLTYKAYDVLGNFYDYFKLTK